MQRALRTRRCPAQLGPVLTRVAALHLLAVLCRGAWLPRGARPRAFEDAREPVVGAAAAAAARCLCWPARTGSSGGGVMPRPNAGSPALGCLLRLRGGKIKYKDLKMVKKAREEGLRRKGENGPPKPKHRAGTRVKERLASADAVHGEDPGGAAREVRSGVEKEAPQAKVRGGRRARKKEAKDEGSDTAATAGLMPDEQALQDEMDMDELAGLGDDAFYGGKDPSDSDEKLKQWEMEAEEVKRLEAIRERELGTEDPELAQIEERTFQEFPSDSDSSELIEADRERRARPQGAQGGDAASRARVSTLPAAASGRQCSYLDFLFKGNASRASTPEGMVELVGEMERAMHTLRSCIEPLLLRCRIFDRSTEALSVAEHLLLEKYVALMRFVVGMQDKILLIMHGAGGSRGGGASDNGADANGVSQVHPLRASSRSDARIAQVDTALDGHWRRLVCLLQLERVMHRHVQALLAQAATMPPVRAADHLLHMTKEEEVEDEGEEWEEEEEEEEEDEGDEAAMQKHREKRLVRERAKVEAQEAAHRAAEAKVEAKEEKALEEKMKLLHMVEDDALALKYGHKWWYQKYAAANALAEKSARGDRLTQEQLHKVGRTDYLHAMWRRAYRLTFPEIRGDPRKPTGGYTVIMEGGRRPAPLEMLTNVKGTRRTRRNRRYSNPRLRLRHRFHDLIVRSRGSTRTMRAEGKGYLGEASGINPRAKHGLDFTWNAMQKKAKRIEKNMKTKS
eukprot:Tamp_02175.p1 GENE.Tamp_02175~~Tamp_02175.p1  ORF type:complete len:738 (+),score=178.03 Tamp_02175:1792-4005(+)